MRAKFTAHTNEIELAGVEFGGLFLGSEQILYEQVLAVLYEKGERAVQCIIVLLDELTGSVDDATGEMPHQKALVVAYLAMRLKLGLARHVQTHVLATAILGVHARSKVLSAGGGQLALFVEQVKEAHALGLDKLDTVLVVHVGDFSQAQTLLFVDALLFFENALVEELLQLFVAVVDAELLEAVDWKVF